jgi:hypothetical protein
MEIKIPIRPFRFEQKHPYFRLWEIVSSLLNISQKILAYSFLLAFPTIVLLSSQEVDMVDFSGVFIKYIFSYIILLALRFLINPKAVRLSFKFDLLLMSFVAIITLVNFIPSVLGMNSTIPQQVRDSRSLANLSFVIGLVFAGLVSTQINKKYFALILSSSIILAVGFIVQDVFWYIMLTLILAFILVSEYFLKSKLWTKTLGTLLILVFFILNQFNLELLGVPFALILFGFIAFIIPQKLSINDTPTLTYWILMLLVFLFWNSPVLILFMIALSIYSIINKDTREVVPTWALILGHLSIIGFLIWLQFPELKYRLMLPIYDLQSFFGSNQSILMNIFGGGSYKASSGYAVILLNYGVIGLLGFLSVLYQMIKEGVVRKYFSVFLSIVLVSIYLLFYGIGDIGFYVIWIFFALSSIVATKEIVQTNLSIFKLKNRYLYIKSIFELVRLGLFLGLLVLLAFILK